MNKTLVYCLKILALMTVALILGYVVFVFVHL